MRLIRHPEIYRIEVLPDVPLLAIAASNFILEPVQRDSKAHITWATGDTMIPVYEATKKIGKRKGISFEDTLASHLDAYWPADPDLDEFSFVRYLRNGVWNALNIPVDRRLEINGMALDPHKEALRYDGLLSQVTLAILGIGPCSHMAFDEQGTPFVARTHFTYLSPETIWRDRVERRQPTPGTAITQGPANIFEAKQILMIAFNPVKGGYLRQALYGPITENCPASGLRLPEVGKKVTIIIDEAAAEVLERK